MENKMGNNNKGGSRPAYVPPQVIRLDKVSTGTGNCGIGSGPAGGDCKPTGNGASQKICRIGNGAKNSCVLGNGVV